jgi:hypothetical protein
MLINGVPLSAWFAWRLAELKPRRTGVRKKIVKEKIVREKKVRKSKKDKDLVGLDKSE